MRVGRSERAAVLAYPLRFVRLRAEREAGKLIAEREKAAPPKLNGRETGSAPIFEGRTKQPPKTLKDLGISKTQSSRWQKLADRAGHANGSGPTPSGHCSPAASGAFPASASMSAAAASAWR